MLFAQVTWYWARALVQDSLGGNTKTTFIVTLSPSEDAIEETLSTLQFANRAKKVCAVLVREPCCVVNA